MTEQLRIKGTKEDAAEIKDNNNKPLTRIKSLRAVKQQSKLILKKESDYEKLTNTYFDYVFVT